MKHPHVTVHLLDLEPEVGALALVSRVSAALRRAGVPVAEREAFGQEAVGGAAWRPTPEHVIEVARKWVNVT